MRRKIPWRDLWLADSYCVRFLDQDVYDPTNFQKNFLTSGNPDLLILCVKHIGNLVYTYVRCFNGVLPSSETSACLIHLNRIPAAIFSTTLKSWLLKAAAEIVPTAIHSIKHQPRKNMMVYTQYVFQFQDFTPAL